MFAFEIIKYGFQHPSYTEKIIWPDLQTIQILNADLTIHSP